MPNKKPMSRQDDIVVQETNGEILIYDLRANKAFCLNETSALIWKACDGTRNVSDLSKHVSQQMKADANDDMVWFALEQLKKEKLLAVTPKADGRFDGMSRREVVRKIGLGTAIALPVIAGLIAPTAVHANSACVAGGTCTCMDSTAGSGNICVASVACTDTNCRCQQTNNGNTMGTCVP